MSEQQLADAENNLIQEIVENAKSNPANQTIDIIFHLLEKAELFEKEGDKDGTIL